MISFLCFIINLSLLGGSFPSAWITQGPLILKNKRPPLISLPSPDPILFPPALRQHWTSPSTHLRPHACLIPSHQGFPILILQLHGDDLKVTVDFQGPKSIPQLVGHNSSKPQSQVTPFSAFLTSSLSLPLPPWPHLLCILSSRHVLLAQPLKGVVPLGWVSGSRFSLYPSAQEISSRATGSATEGCWPRVFIHLDFPSEYPNVY